MGYVDVAWRGGAHFKAHETDLRFFRVIKTRKEHHCSNCKKKIPSKSYAFYSAWSGLCLDCGEKFSHTAIKGYQDIIDYIKLNQDKFKKNKQKWEAENTLNQL